MFISFIIVNYNTKFITSDCIASIYKNPYLDNNYEVIVVDNNSSDGSVEYLKEKYPNIKIIASDRNLGFGKANNLGVSYSKGDIIIFLNSDTLVDKTNFKILTEILLSNDSIGFLSCKILNIDGSIQSVGYEYPNLKNTLKSRLLFWDYNFVKKIRFRNYKDKGLFQVDWVSGCFMICEKKKFKKIEGFDESIFLYSEDIDICFRMNSIGYKNYVYDRTSIYHLHGKSGDKLKMDIKRILGNYKNLFYVIEKNKLSKYPKLIKYITIIHIYIVFILKKVLNTLLKFHANK